jgi:CRISPR-associated protein Csx10
VPILKVTITACAPLVFSERRPDGQFRASTSYVPGAVLRGALAQQLLNAGEATDGDFAKLFTASSAPFFHNAYPAVEADGECRASRPLPATAFSCKAESGFDKHGVFDGLIDRLCHEELGVKIPYLPRCRHDDHKDERGRNQGERVEAFGGLVVNHRSVSVPSQLTTRVAINRRRKAAEEGLLYSPLVISELKKERDKEGQEREIKTVFQGSILVSDKGEVVKQRLEQLTHIGSGAARGFGQVEVKVEEAKTEDISARLEQFNQTIRQRWGLWKKLPHAINDPVHTADNGTFFAVLLVADAILRADDWTPTVRLEPSLLPPALQDASLVRCYATAEYRGGWNTAWGLPKDTELVARLGSVYVYHIAKPPADQGLLAALNELEEWGVGERRVEGFGQVRICDEFHQVIQEVKA